LWWWDADLIEWGVGGMLGFHGADIGRAARRAGAEGAQGGLEIWANTVTFGATDYAGYTESTKYSGSEYDGARIAAKVSRTGFLGAAGGAAVQGTMAGLGTLASQGGTIGNVATVARGGLNAYFAVKSAQSTGENLGTATGEFESGNYGSAALYGTLGVIDAASSGMSASGAYRDLSKGLPGLADDLNRVLAASGHDPKGGWIETGNAPRTKATSTEPTLPGNPVAQSGEVNITHKYRSGDHGPAHLHVEGGGISTRIGGAGKPINATDAPMTRAQQKVYDANKSAIRRATKKTGKWLEYQELPDN
jgi:hypothetical protein